jgi:hypothetical protein
LKTKFFLKAKFIKKGIYTFLFCSLVELGFELAEQVLYCLSHTSSPFCSGYFGDYYLPGVALNHDPPDLSLPSS